MDQSKTNLPHFQQKCKQTSGFWKLKTHVTGAIVHGQGVYGYFDVCQWKHSSNMTIIILLNILFMYRDSLPEVLYLQMDNCARENKNKYVFAFCALLVELGIFRKIKVSFLMVGHTHEDVDQMFSRYSTYLGRSNSFTMDSLMDAFENSYTPTPTAVLLDNLPDFVTWLKPYMANIVKLQSYPHVFKFIKNRQGKSELFVKKWSSDIDWLACSGAGNGHLLEKMPVGTPPLVKPNYNLENDLSLVRGGLKHAEKFLTPEAKQWWDNWFVEIQETEGRWKPMHVKIDLSGLLPNECKIM